MSNNRRIRAAALLGIATTAILAFTVAPAPAAPPPTGPESTSDVKPPTQPVSSVRPSPHPDNGKHRGVRAVVHHPNGSATLTSYTPAPGVTEAELYRRLKAAGVQGLEDPNTTPVRTLDDGSCAWFSATTITCPRIEWPRNGHGHPQIYFADHSSAAWPVDAAVRKWNEARGVDSWYRWQTCSSVAGAHCVHVRSGNFGSDWTGRTDLTWQGDFILSAEVRLNDFFGGTATEHRNTSCHELGHALGMGHNGSTASCMFSARNNSVFPDGNDFNLIADLYA